MMAVTIKIVSPYRQVHSACALESARYAYACTRSPEHNLSIAAAKTALMTVKRKDFAALHDAYSAPRAALEARARLCAYLTRL